MVQTYLALPSPPDSTVFLDRSCPSSILPPPHQQLFNVLALSIFVPAPHLLSRCEAPPTWTSPATRHPPPGFFLLWGDAVKPPNAPRVSPPLSTKFGKLSGPIFGGVSPLKKKSYQKDNPNFGFEDAGDVRKRLLLQLRDPKKRIYRATHDQNWANNQKNGLLLTFTDGPVYVLQQRW